MAYSTNAQVGEELAGVSFSSSTKVTDTTVDRWIGEADAYIDSFVGRRYEVPVDVSATSAIKILQMISIYLVADRVQRKLEVKQASSEITQEGDAGWRTRWADRKLKAIAEGAIELSDATALSTGQGVSSFNVSNDIEHTYKKNTDQW